MHVFVLKTHARNTPSEPEYRNAERLRGEGIYIEDGTWSRIGGIIAENELDDKIGDPI
ncbi:MAG: hypothetical protein ACERKS_07590 [Candidatus Bathyarchaeota archaeon]